MRHLTLAQSGLISLFLSAAPLPAQELLQDIQKGLTGLDLSSAEELAVIGDRLFFAGSDPEFGIEPRMLAAGSNDPQLVFDIQSGTSNSFPEEFFEMPDGRVIFRAFTSSSGSEPWVTDGTPGGTHLLADLNPTGSSTPRSFVRFGERVLFFAFTPETGYELWRTDGTPSGTELVLDTLPGPEGVESLTIYDLPLTVLDTCVVFAPFNNVTDLAELWRSDGTPAGTRKLADLPDVFNPNVDEMGSTGSVAVFRAFSELSSQPQLWRTDGTVAGTEAIMDFDLPGGGAPDRFFAIGSLVYFQAGGLGLGRELWVTDGTSGGTRLVIDLQPGEGPFGNSSNPKPIAELGGELMFKALHPDYGFEYFLTDGTAAGTRLVADIVPGPEGGGANVASGSGAELAGHLVFTAETPGAGVEVWRTDGTSTGTALIADLEPGVDSSFPGSYVALGDRVYFGARNSAVGEEVFSTDLHTAGPVADLYPTPASGGSNPSDFVRFGDLAVFVADDMDHGRELWTTDGTPEGTQLLKDIRPGPLGSFPTDLFQFGSQVLFVATTEEHGEEPWITDGTPQGTTLLADLRPGPFGSISYQFAPAVFGNRAFFQANGSQSTTLFVTDGTSAGTVPFFELNSPHFASQPVVAYDGHLYLRSSLPGIGLELFRVTDDPSTVELVADIEPGPGSGTIVQFSTFELEDGLLFEATDVIHGRELWITDGTTTGTRLVADLNPGPGSSGPANFQPLAGGAAFLIIDDQSSRQVAWTDGTTENTQQLTSGEGLEFTLVAGGELAYFLRTSPLSGHELWTTDGTLAGTQFVVTLEEFEYSLSFRDDLVPAGSGELMLFPGNDLLNGEELWITDGTAAGTGLLADLWPGGSNSAPDEFFRLGDTLLFSAVDENAGRELFGLSVSELGAWVGEPFGQACPGGDHLFVEGTTQAGQAFEVRLDSSLAAAASVLGVSGSSTFAPWIEGCTTYLAEPIFLLPFTGNSSGKFALTASLDAALTGLPFQLQALVIGGSELRLSNGLEIVAGG